MAKISKKIKKLLKEKSGIRLDIGGGNNPQKGFVNMDMRDLKKVDIVHNVEEFPWPLPDESVVMAVASHLVEHIKPWKFIDFMNEAWRVLKYDAEFGIVCPYATSPGFYQDPSHCNQITERTWSYFDPLDKLANGSLYKIYMPKPWKIKTNTWHSNGNMEVVLVKRREDPSYYKKVKKTMEEHGKKEEKK